MSSSTIATLSKLTVVILKERLKELKLNTKGIKKELVERLAAHLDAEKTQPTLDDSGKNKSTTPDKTEEPPAQPKEETPPTKTEKDEPPQPQVQPKEETPVEAAVPPSEVETPQQKEVEKTSPKKETQPVPSPTKTPAEPTKTPAKSSPVKSPTKSSSSSKDDHMEIVKEEKETGKGKEKEEKGEEKAKEEKKEEQKQTKEAVPSSPSKVDVDFEGDSAVKDLMETSDEEGRKKRKRDGSPAPSEESRSKRAQKETTSSAKNSSTNSTRERTVPKSAVAPTDTLLIKNFVRPFRIEQVKELLGQTGSILNFWMDDIRTHCYVTYQNKEEAIATREAVYDLDWPVHNNKRLVAEFSTKDELDRASRRSGQKTAGNQQQTQTHQQPSSSSSSSSTPSTSSQQKPAEKKTGSAKEEAPSLTLDTLFRKTKAKPCIYYLPLNEKEIEEKKTLDAQKNNNLNSNAKADGPTASAPAPAAASDRRN
eukprot:TRINITY_DN644_c0_g2_i1.p1 TRINITY_DN644_c0_g2~~TRINITY_DN644_c0_g2_i1.p1  ORF type:complete len:480 (-),score=206.69 TRINITY_DN644_c0_g2_i1:126-1565(-)